MEQIDTDTLIVGAGPAGLQLAHDLQAAGVDHLVVEASHAPGAFFRRFPRHRTLISVNKRGVDPASPADPLRFDWNSLLSDDPSLRFTDYSDRYFPHADDMVRYLADYADRLGLRVRYNSRVASIERAVARNGSRRRNGSGNGAGATAETGFVVEVEGQGAADDAVVHARLVVLATGVTPHEPPIPGIELVERYDDFATDPDGFRDARVLIIGKGNSAFETAQSLLPTAGVIHVVSPSPIRFAWTTHYVGHLRAVNNELLDAYQLKIGCAVLDAEVTSIRRSGAEEGGFEVDLAYTHAEGQRVTYRYDRVISAAGFRLDDGALAGLSPERRRDGRLPDMTADYRSVSEPGLYFAGTLMQARDHGKTGSGFIHGFRYNVRFLAKVLQARLAGREAPPPDAVVAGDPEALAACILGRLDRDDAIYLQNGHLADAFVASYGESGEHDATERADPDGGGLAHHRAVPLDWVRDGGLGRGFRITASLEFGPRAPDPFNVARSTDPSYAKVTPYLHPVIRALRGDDEVDRLDLLEDVENRYRPDDYGEHLVRFLRGALSVL